MLRFAVVFLVVLFTLPGCARLGRYEYFWAFAPDFAVGDAWVYSHGGGFEVGVGSGDVVTAPRNCRSRAAV